MFSVFLSLWCFAQSIFALSDQAVLDAFAAQLVRDGWPDCKAVNLIDCPVDENCEAKNCGNFRVKVTDHGTIGTLFAFLSKMETVYHNQRRVSEFSDCYSHGGHVFD